MSWLNLPAMSYQTVINSLLNISKDVVLRVDEIVSIWKSAAANLKTLNPNLRIIFTVSPIRHLKDGFEGNARSKAILVLACEKLCSEIEGVDYFPSYEIITDDLRDYRFLR